MYVLIFLQGQWLPSYSQFCHFSLNKSFKTYLGLTLPPGIRNWQLISPHSSQLSRTVVKNIIYFEYDIDTLWKKSCSYLRTGD
jgi:hypothetical protein